MTAQITSWMLPLMLAAGLDAGGEEWPQFKYDARHSGNVPGRSVTTPLRLEGAVALSDAVLTAPAVSDGRVYVVDASGVATCLEASSLRVLWKFESKGGEANCNNISSPAIAGPYLHFGTMAGRYYVLDKNDGSVVKEIACGEPVFSAPVVSNGRVYFATLGSRVFALEPDGTHCWSWDFCKDQAKFPANRWDGQAWALHKKGRATRSDQFMCAWDLASYGKMLVVPAGGSVVWLEDAGEKAQVRAVDHPRTPTLGMSIGMDGTVYRQWHFLDNGGRVEMLRLRDGEVEKLGFVPGTETGTSGRNLLSFNSVSPRGKDIFRTRVQAGMGLCRHSPESEEPRTLHPAASIAPPILLREKAVYGDLQGNLHVVPLSGSGEAWTFKTPFGKAISAPPAVCDGRIYFGCEDGYLYVLGPEGGASLPDRDLKHWEIRSPLEGSRADTKFDRFAAFGDYANTNVDRQGLKPPFKVKWIRRFEGSTKHFSTCGGGRTYTHTAEGQVFAVEQETGRLLWRAFYPGVHICYTAPLYDRGRLLVPQAGLDRCVLRCLDAATGKLLWEAPFAGSPGWNRQQSPVIHGNLVIYMYGTGRYGPVSREGENVGWLFPLWRMRDFPASHKPRVRAYDLETGKVVWEKDFSEHGSGGDDAGLCLMDGTLYYSCWFGQAPRRRGIPAPRGITAAMDPTTGRVLWSTTQYSLQGGCTLSGAEGRLYLSGYSPVGSSRGRHVWCLDAKDGSLVWRSDPLVLGIHVVTVGPRFVFVHGQRIRGYLLDKQTGKTLKTVAKGYKCTRFTLSEPFLLGCNMDVIDVSDVNNEKLISSGPPVDPSECVGGIVSNGRLFYTAHGSGIQLSKVYGEEAEAFTAPWER